MPNEQVVNPDQTSAFESPWSYGQRALRAMGILLVRFLSVDSKAIQSMATFLVARI
jgi:hypothetical protein